MKVKLNKSTKKIILALLSKVAGFALCAVTQRYSFADQYHYNNFLLGPVPQGMGGAGIAKSDNPAGVYYNPGGTSFAAGTSFSGSSAAFYIRNTTYQNVFANENLKESSRGAASTFLGALSRFGGKFPASGYTVGFALAVPDTKLSDESTSIDNLKSANIVRYVRNQTSRENALLALVSASANMGSQLGLGVSAGYFEVDELYSADQEALQGPYKFAATGETKVFSYNLLTSRRLLRMSGLMLGAGFRFQVRSSFSVGGCVAHRNVVKQNSLTKIRKVNSWVDADFTPIAAGVNGSEPEFNGKIQSESSYNDTSSKKAALPVFLSFGFSWSPTWYYSLAADLQSYTSRMKNSEPLRRSSVSNIHVGQELKLGRLITTRAGAFTNFDATPTRNVEESTSRGEFIDYLGATGSLALQFKGAEYGINYMQQWGKGKAEKTVGQVSKVDSKLQVLAVTAVQSMP